VEKIYPRIAANWKREFCGKTKIKYCLSAATAQSLFGYNEAKLEI
jgi:hypothetical protein